MTLKLYNGRIVDTVLIPRGTRVWRIFNTDDEAIYPPNEFRTEHIAPLVDARRFDPFKDKIPLQGRFDPVHDIAVCPGGDQLGGYIYVGLSVSAVVAEGILRNVDIPEQNILSASLLQGRSLVEMELGEDIRVVTLDDQRVLTQINLDASIDGCTFEFYGDTRKSGTDILVAHSDSNGLRYDCRHGKGTLALLLVDRGSLSSLKVMGSSYPLDQDNEGRRMVLDCLWEEHGQIIA